MSRVDTRVSPPTGDAAEPPAKAVSRPTATSSRTPKRHRSDIVRAFHLLRTHRGGTAPYVLTFIMLCFEALTAVLEPVPIAYTVDFVSGEAQSLRDLGFPAFMANEQWETIVLLGLGIIAIAAINKGSDSLAEVFIARAGRELGYNIRVTMYDRLQKLSMAFHDKRRTGDVLTRVTGDVLVVEEFVVASLTNIIASFLLLFGSFAVLFTRSREVALIAIVVVPLLALVANWFSLRLKKVSKEQRSKEGDLASTAQEMLSSIRLVQSYGRGHVDLERFSVQSDQSMRASLKIATIQAQFSWVIAVLEGLTIASVVWVSYWLVTADVITAGDLVLFVLLISNMFKPSRKIVSEWYKVGKLLASTERIEELLEREPAVQDAPDAKDAPALTGRLTFDDVTFSYRPEHENPAESTSRTVLHDISFTAEPGEVLALIGPSGAGKSSIAQLVPRLYDPDSGTVRIDGMDVRGFTLASLRRQVSLVLQETLLLTGTVAENIAYGIDDATPEQIEAAARLAHAHHFIQELSDGYDTVLGERGSTLSGGQRQRLAIARAFIRQAPVLVLDEPTTGLDPYSSDQVIAALRSLIEGRTTIIISHDLELVRCADRVLVLDSGRIVQEGTPEELADVGGLYADLFNRGSGEDDPAVGTRG
ncbi:ATP-binding cassette domain-containing protein [Nostocoides sp. F2B08]|uniref:ABC transporter ATP-binding protein n=1 Tax=Nostocoides sp. F2B08 TaxID=2653936 RepID=UPI0012639A92|nr:ABC transporter ATP-binding protein [Tetrasphaera sp. F2B08]KAB7746394.1 ATP-binding cassette domain-containing protein [Tetrasphaera sp. F2B08]